MKKRRITNIIKAKNGSARPVAKFSKMVEVAVILFNPGIPRTPYARGASIFFIGHKHAKHDGGDSQRCPSVPGHIIFV